MKNTQKGFIVPALIVLVAVLGTGWGVSAYREHKATERLQYSMTPVDVPGPTVKPQTSSQPSTQTSSQSGRSSDQPAATTKGLTNAQILTAFGRESSVMARGDVNADGYDDAIIMTTSCGASCSSSLHLYLNEKDKSVKAVAGADFSPAYVSSSAAQTGLSRVTISNGIIALTGNGLACFMPGSEKPCTQDDWNVVKTVKYRFNGTALVQI